MEESTVEPRGVDAGTAETRGVEMSMAEARVVQASNESASHAPASIEQTVTAERDARHRRRRPLHDNLPSNRGARPDCGRPRSGRRSESGSGTVLGLALILVIVGCMAAMCAVGSALAVRERVVVTSDLAALAAASTQAGLADGIPCERASEVAARAQVELTDCTIIGDDVVVSVAGNAAGITLSARSRAGPAPDDVDDVESTHIGTRFRGVNPQDEIDIGRCDPVRYTATDTTGATRPWPEGNTGR